MRVGVISDIHANLVALEAVLADLPAVDALVCAGDIIGYNPWPAECIERVRAQAMISILGNHDRKIVTGSNFVGNRMAAAGIDLAAEQLTADQRSWLEALPDDRLLFDDRLHLVHGHPDDPDRYTYPEAFGPDLLDRAPVLVLGHTHIQHVEQLDGGVVLNPGSVGQPRDGDPRAGYAVVDLDELTAEPRRVPYDIKAVQDAIVDAGLPRRTGDRLADGR